MIGISFQASILPVTLRISSVQIASRRNRRAIRIVRELTTRIQPKTVRVNAVTQARNINELSTRCEIKYRSSATRNTKRKTPSRINPEIA